MKVEHDFEIPSLVRNISVTEYSDMSSTDAKERELKEVIERVMGNKDAMEEKIKCFLREFAAGMEELD